MTGDPRAAVIRHLVQLPDFQDRITACAAADAFRESSPAYWTRRSAEWATVGTEDADGVALACARHSWLLADIAAEQAWTELSRWEKAA